MMVDEVVYDWNQRHTRKQKPAATIQPVAPANGYSGTANGYGQAALTRELEQLLATPEGRRNDALNVASFNLHQLVASGHLPELEVHDQLRAAALRVGLTSSETEATIASGKRAGELHPRQVKPLELVAPVVTEVSHEELGITRETIDETTGEVTEIAVDFWDSRDILQHIRDFAYSRMTSPWSMLGVCMLRALAVTPPNVVLPPLIGGYGSLNMFLAIVGPSGVGKGATESAAIDAIDFRTEIYTAPVGSGEGIAHQYAHHGRQGLTRDRDSVLFTVSEVDTLTALGSRQGSTLLSQLRSAFSGERLGFGYADATRRIPIERHTYRLGMTVGVQPEKAGPLIYDADGGTPQRFIWLPATDPHIDANPAPTPPQWVIEQHRWAPGRDLYTVLTVPQIVARTIRESHAERARGNGEALDGHALFAREKVAQALTLLDGRRTMTEEDWDLSGIVMAVSDLTRTRITATLDQKVKAADSGRAHREASRAVLISETVADAAVKRVAARISKLITAAGERTWADLRRDLASRDREHFEEAVERAVAAGQIELNDTPTGRIVKARGRAQKSGQSGHVPGPDVHNKKNEKNPDESSETARL